MYTYYVKIESEEHMLYADELAEIFNIRSLTNKHHSLFISMYLKDWVSKHIKDYKQLSFINRYGGTKDVYPAIVYMNAFVELLETMKELNIEYAISIGSKIYKVKRLESEYNVVEMRKQIKDCMR